jgi:hypothetical protein
VAAGRDRPLRSNPLCLAPMQRGGMNRSVEGCTVRCCFFVTSLRSFDAIHTVTRDQLRLFNVIDTV